MPEFIAPDKSSLDVKNPHRAGPDITRNWKTSQDYVVVLIVFLAENPVIVIRIGEKTVIDFIERHSYNLRAMDEEIRRFIEEDLGTGDITTNATVPEDHISLAEIFAKEDGILAGQPFAKKAFHVLDEGIHYEEIKEDGAPVKKGDLVARIQGRTRAILSGERVALNLLQRLSGIATATKRFVDATGNTGVKILDTRKTSPGLRMMEKYAVRMGGGHNHRLNLSEMALIKENHIAVAGSVKEAVKRVRTASSVFIEVEVKNMNELRDALEEGVDRIMLDNWAVEDIAQAVSFVQKRIPIEISGNMTLERTEQVSPMGIDFISVGATTHSFKSLDLSLLVREEGST
ncbi:MAG: putative nicotinate-nucleotide pyrophosphorylase (carboxylating) [Syntrophorhabdus sp. PtaU1.Bin002]|nr:MAG: putative nicotinate-nucleotide pyrophosphorylase (carboxylating) [Syntrophorhabdus sp. PtaU1.Bin002]